ncbi:hypothetical protein PPYR_11774 [Photinus pyralis]|uniref:H15 domain-containing protein n=1 Tax=Photinus pyralis TaxID=7054 RepID=A0A1Y1KIB5_PHOPY|nr:hypothetical protein PPYR_11774 [Photinus pyralis]
MASNSSYLREIIRAIKVLDKEDGVTMKDLTRYLTPRVCKRYRNRKYAMLGVCAALRRGVESGNINVKPERYFLKRHASLIDTSSSSSYSSVDDGTRSKIKSSDSGDRLPATFTHQNSPKKVKQEETVHEVEVVSHTQVPKNSIDHIETFDDTNNSNNDDDDIKNVPQEETTVHEVEVLVHTVENKNSIDYIEQFERTRNSNNDDRDIALSLMYIN